MYTRDSRSATGGGIIAQDHSWFAQTPTVQLENRCTELAYRLTGRDEVGRWLYDKTTLGDVCGLMVWKQNDGSGDAHSTSVPRSIPAWRHAFPVRQTAFLKKVAVRQPPPAKDPIDIGDGGGGQAISLYFPLGSEPDTTVQGGMQYTISSHVPTKTYTTVSGLVIGAYLYYATGSSVGMTLKAAVANQPKAGTPAPPIVNIVLQLTYDQVMLGAPINAPPAPPGYHYRETKPGNYSDIFNPGGPPQLVSLIFVYFLNGSTPSPEPPPPPPPIDDPGDGGDGDAGPDLELLPIWHDGYNADNRFKPLKIPMHKRRNDWNSFPTDTQGIVLATTDEDQQIEDFFPTDPRLVSVNFGGGYDCGSILYDTNPTAGYDTNRWARLQSLVRIIREPVYNSGYGNQGAPAANNALALQFGLSGNADAIGGFVFDRDTLAKWGHHDGGCMNVGLLVDKHRGGQDFDGHPINGMHVDAFANFLRDTAHDGPLFFEDEWPEPVDDGNFAVKVHMGWDPKQSYNWPRNGGGAYLQGMWRWWMKILVTAETPSGFHPEITPPTQDFPKPPGGPNVPGNPQLPNGSGFTQGNAPTVIYGSASYVLGDYRRPAVIANELSLPGLVARPQRYQRGADDIRYINPSLPENAVADYLRSAPVTGRLSAWGGQGGTTGGPYLTGTTGTEAGGPWVRTQQVGTSRHRSGTGPGGWLISSPEIGLEDVDTSFAPTGLTLSTTYFATAPGAYFGAGIPELATGGLRSGWRWGLSSTALVFSSMSSTGAATVWVTMDPTAGIKLGDAAGQKLGLYGATPVVQSAGWVDTTNHTDLKTGDETTGTLPQAWNMLGTIQRALKAIGVLGG